VLYFGWQFQLCLSHDCNHRFYSILFQSIDVLSEYYVSECQSLSLSLLGRLNDPVKMTSRCIVFSLYFIGLHEVFKIMSIYNYIESFTRNNINYEIGTGLLSHLPLT
jgi:hypothetical protein